MFSHVMIGSNDVDKSKTFYDAVLGTLGSKPGMANGDRVMYLNKGGVFMVTKPIDGNAACHANGGTIGFAADTTEEVDAFHAAGLTSGGSACEDPPGIREGSFGQLYLSYLRDPDGNKVCAMKRMG